MRLRESFDKREEKMKNFSLFLAVTFQSRRNIPGEYIPFVPAPFLLRMYVRTCPHLILDLGSGIWDRSGIVPTQIPHSSVT